MMIQRCFIFFTPVMFVGWIAFTLLLVPWYVDILNKLQPWCAAPWWTWEVSACLRCAVGNAVPFLIIYTYLSCTMAIAMAPVMTYTHILKKENICRQRPWEALLLFFPAYAPLVTFASALFYPPISELIYECNEEGLFDLLTLLLAVIIFFALPLTPVFFLLRYFVRRMLKITSAADNHSAPEDKPANG